MTLDRNRSEQAPRPALGALPGPVDEPLYGHAANAIRDQLREPSDLAVAIRVAQKMLTAYSDTSNFSEFGYAQAHGALSESLRLLLHALDAEPEMASEPDTVSHENGLTFKVIPTNSHDARTARNVHSLTMTDGTVWTVGNPVGWHGVEAAWRTEEQAGGAR